MPNLNRIRGRGGGFGYRGGMARNSAAPGSSSSQGTTGTRYGLSKIHNSDSRIGNQGTANSSRMLPPNAIPRVGRNQQYRPQGNVSRQPKANDGKMEVSIEFEYHTMLKDIMNVIIIHLQSTIIFHFVFLELKNVQISIK